MTERQIRNVLIGFGVSVVLAVALIGYAWFTRPVQSPCPPGVKATQEGCR